MTDIAGIVTDLFEADGWDTLYLGANLPASGVIKAVEQHRPDLLVISITMAFHLAGAEHLIAQVRSSEAGSRIKVMVGGYPFNLDPDLWQRVRADGHAADAGEALTVAARLLDLQEPKSQSGRKTYPAEMLAGVVGLENAGQRPAEVASYDELSRLNSELVTVQRELARKNAQLERLNERGRDDGATGATTWSASGRSARPFPDRPWQDGIAQGVVGLWRSRPACRRRQPPSG